MTANVQVISIIINKLSKPYVINYVYILNIVLIFNRRKERGNVWNVANHDNEKSIFFRPEIQFSTSIHSDKNRGRKESVRTVVKYQRDRQKG